MHLSEGWGFTSIMDGETEAQEVKSLAAGLEIEPRQPGCRSYPLNQSTTLPSFLRCVSSQPALSKVFTPLPPQSRCISSLSRCIGLS